MPTGYTAALYDGKRVSFPEFAMTCARAFGACVEMKDDLLDTRIPDEFQASTYAKERLKKSRDELRRVELWTAGEAEEAAHERYNEELQYFREHCALAQERRERYSAMLEKVEAWTPPSPEHKEFKAFMQRQLTDSIKHDCFDIDPPVRKIGVQHRRERIDSLKSDIEYYERSHREEIERTNGRNLWLRQLRDSLKPKEKSDG